MHLKERQNRLPKGKLLHRVFCRRLSHLANQVRAPLTRLVSGQGSFAPCRLDRQIPATMCPSDAVIWPRQRLWLPARGCPASRAGTPNRASQVPGGSFRARCLLSPRGVRSVHLIEASQPILASPYPAGWPLPVSRNEAEPSSRDATARALAFPSFNGWDRSHPLKGRLHDFRSSITVNTFQLTRTSQALLGAFQMDTDEPSAAKPQPARIGHGR